MKPNTIGLIEVHGWVAAVEAGDAMLKAARVQIFCQHSISPGLVTVAVEGDIASCRAAVDAAEVAVRHFGGVVAQRVIGRPDADTWLLIATLLYDSEPPAIPGAMQPPEA